MRWDVAAAVLGASVIEKHFCITREEETVDSAFSMEKGEFAEMIRAVRNAKAAVGALAIHSPRRSGGVWREDAPSMLLSRSRRASASRGIT